MELLNGTTKYTKITQWDDGTPCKKSYRHGPGNGSGKEYAEDMSLSVQHEEFTASTLRLHIRAIFLGAFYLLARTTFLQSGIVEHH